MIRKWEWVREYCKRQGYEESAEVADRIDRVLCYLYGEVDTEEWKDIMETGRFGIKEDGSIDLPPIGVYLEIIFPLPFCVACDWSECSDSDSGCEFYRLTGQDLIDAFIDARSKEFEGLQAGLARLV